MHPRCKQFQYQTGLQLWIRTTLTIRVICFTGLSLEPLPQELLLFSQILLDEAVLAHFFSNLQRTLKIMMGRRLQGHYQVKTFNSIGGICHIYLSGDCM